MRSIMNVHDEVIQEYVRNYGFYFSKQRKMCIPISHVHIMQAIKCVLNVTDASNILFLGLAQQNLFKIDYRNWSMLHC